MLISIFTPTNDAHFLEEAYHSLLAQTCPDWEWILMPNGGLERPAFDDPRVRVYDPFLEINLDRIGALKRMACAKASGDILLELDQDDLLAPTALERVAAAFADDPELIFVYSNVCQVNEDLFPRERWSEVFGWHYREVELFGRRMLECLEPAPEPQNLSRIWYAPDHLRAWRAKDYWRIGGHDQSMTIADDHDLLCRTYLYGKMKHIDAPLYVYRVHGGNNWLRLQNEIQETQWNNYERYKYALAEKWARDRGLVLLDLCGGLDSPEQFTSIDRKNAAIVADLDDRWPLPDNSVGVIRAFDALEHLKDPIHAMNEAWRVLTHGGFFFSLTPSTDGPDGRAGRGAFQDPTHVSFWNQNSFWYYTRATHRRYIEPRAVMRFQDIRTRTFYPNQFCFDNAIPYVQADLVALKDGPRFHGLVEV